MDEAITSLRLPQFVIYGGKVLGVLTFIMEAELAKEKTNGYKLDKSHVFAVNLFDEFEKYMKIPDEWTPAEIKPYAAGFLFLDALSSLSSWLFEFRLVAILSHVPHGDENLQKWLMDEKARDQFVIHAGIVTEVFWNDPRQMMPELVYRRQIFTAVSAIIFKDYLVLAKYASHDILYIPSHSRLYSKQVIFIGYAMTWFGVELLNPLPRHIFSNLFTKSCNVSAAMWLHFTQERGSFAEWVVLNFFDTRTGKLMREFKGNADDFASGSSSLTGVSWPVFRWGGGKEDKYFARLGKNLISVYETETFTLIDKKSLKVENVVDFTWSPTDPIIALFVPELGGGNQPARVSLIQIPSKEELRQKNLFNVSDIKMYWQNNGEYLAVKVNLHTKTKKSTTTGFELFRIKERDIPIEDLELENKNDKIVAFAWEPKGHRFGIIHGDGPRPDVSFYSMRTAQNTGRVSKLATLKAKQANALYWSPAGRFIVLAGLKGFNGQLEFYNVDELETMATGEHFMATDIEWDPTGRYCATSVTSVHEMENGFHIWSFNGKLLYRIPKDHFYQFLWRPRPPSLLTPEKEEEIAKNLKKYSKKYEAEDQDVSLQLSEQDRRKRKMIQDEWGQWTTQWKKLHEQEKEARLLLRDGEASDADEKYESKEVEVEEVIDVVEEIISFDEDAE
ncbi:Eukaryotic translation initiation factor 3 subunit B [Platanthera guangdongensis]|uniref:Eukaryotic translation initiation factor 3 subunit B n=1 Tax=Platanthera guangdongensis TaxID=2320717 RepID=A0ABR2N1P2_9ASPA